MTRPAAPPSDSPSPAGADTAADSAAAAVPAVRHSARFVHHAGTTVYAETLWPEPAAAAGRPAVVMIHGGGHSGACYLLTADNRPGWAPAFAAAGHPVVLPDWPGCGRSGDVPFEDLDGARVVAALGAVLEEAAALHGPVVLLTHSMSGALGWKLIEGHRAAIARVVAVAPGPPGNIQPEADIVAATDATLTVESFGMRRTLARDRVYLGGEEFARHKLIGRSTRFPAAAIPQYAAHVAGVPPRLIAERLNVRGSQLRVADTAPFAGLPVLVVTGEFDTDHPYEVDAATVDWLRDAGADAAFCWLPDRGIAGNGHMVMMEDNADEIAALILEWIAAG